MATRQTNGLTRPPIPETTPLIIHPPPLSRARLNHLDNIRIFLTTLVILHHTAIPYGGLGSWEYHSPCFPALSLPLATFNSVNQTFFMALFYWMAGYFSYLELGRRGVGLAARRGFVLGRVKRLVVPSLFFTVFLAPGLRVMSMLWKCSQIRPSECEQGISSVWLAVKTYVGFWSTIRGIKGPVWFCVLLAIFDTCSAMLGPARLSLLAQVFSPQRLQTSRGLASVLLPVITSAFLIRVYYPVGTIFTPLNIQSAFLPQYIFAYLVGHGSAATNTSTLRFVTLGLPNPQTSPSRTLRIALTVQLLSLSAILGLAHVLTANDRDPLSVIVGGFSLPAFLDVTRNELGFITIAPALVEIFAQRYHSPMKVKLPWRRRFSGMASAEVKVARYAFATFLVHPVVSLAVELGVEVCLGCCVIDPGNLRSSGEAATATVWSVVGPVVMTAAVGTLNVVLSWLVAIGLIDLVPALERWV